LWRFESQTSEDINPEKNFRTFPFVLWIIFYT
jgi:hypothetical protein